jgi:hypothetical protein
MLRVDADNDRLSKRSSKRFLAAAMVSGSDTSDASDGSRSRPFFTSGVVAAKT